MKTHALLALFVLTAASLSTPATPDPTDLILRYLARDCGTGERNPAELLEEVVALRDEALDLLLRALREGPDTDHRERIENQAREDYKRLLEFVRNGGLDSLEETEVAQAAREIQEEEYVAGRLHSAVTGHRERALHALEQIGGPTVRKALEEIARRPEIEPRLRRWILAAVERLED